MTKTNVKMAEAVSMSSGMSTHARVDPGLQEQSARLVRAEYFETKL